MSTRLAAILVVDEKYLNQIYTSSPLFAFYRKMGSGQFIFAVK